MIAWPELFCRLRKAAENVARNDAGSTIVEMAISSMLLFAAIFGIFQVTMACYTYNCVTEAARESARWAMVRGSKCSTYTPGLDHCGATSTDIQNHAKSTAAINWSSCTGCVQASWLKGTTVNGTTQATTTWATCTGGCPADPGNMVIVVVNYPYTYSIPFVKRFSLNLTSTAEMVVSQ